MVAQRTREQTLRSLTIIVGVQWMGSTLGLPLLPLFLRHRGGSPTIVGFVIAAFFVAGLATQFVVGHLSDRFGRRRILVWGLIAYAVASGTYLLPVGAQWFALSRAVQGIGAGAIEVASLSAVSELFGESERGRAISKILAAQLLGTALGPMLGSLVTVNHLGWAFLAAGVASSVVSIRALRSDLGHEGHSHLPLPKLQRTRQLYGAIAAAISVGLCIGVYETDWSQLMHHLGATSFEIRLSWTTFCIPWVLLSRVGGWLADHANRKYIAAAGLTSTAIFLGLYPHIHTIWMLLALGPLEAVGAALSVPSTSSLLTQGATPNEMGRRQGLFTSANTAALAASAGCAGALFSINPTLPFTVVAIVSLASTASLLYWWRHVTGRISVANAPSS